jgi:ABC-type Mn2+/Zn2+ transport system permease subunit
MSTSILYPIILGSLAAAAAGLVGAFALMKRTILAGDVMSHIAIPGLGLALIWKMDPLIGGGLTLFLGILLIWRLNAKTELSSEAAIGVLFASSVALGALLIHSDEGLVDALFGGFGSLSLGDVIFGAGAAVVVLIVLWFLRNRLILSLFSPELAATSGVNVNVTNLIYLLLFGLSILSTLRFLGALLVGSLIIVPASAARQLTHSLAPFLAVSALLSAASMLLGFYISTTYGWSLGPTVVVVAAAFFVLSLFKKKV